MIGVAIGGGLGALLRGELEALGRRRDWSLGRATLLINVIGAFALGLMVGAWGLDGVPEGIGVGFLGGFTTYSTWMAESVDLPEANRGGARLRLGVILAMVILGIGAAAGGYAAGRLV